MLNPGSSAWGRSSSSLSAAAQPPQPTHLRPTPSRTVYHQTSPVGYLRQLESCVLGVFPGGGRLRLFSMAGPPAAFRDAQYQQMRGILADPFQAAAEAFLPPQITQCFSGNASVKQCLTVMSEAHLRSCMVALDPSESPCSGDPGARKLSVKLPPSNHRPSQAEVCSFFRMLDMRDILQRLLRDDVTGLDNFIPENAIHQETPLLLSPCSSANGSDDEGQTSVDWKPEREKSDISHLYKAVEAILAEPVKDIANISGRNNFAPCWEDDPFETLIAALEISPRVPVFAFNNRTGELTLRRIFSATDLFILLNKSAFFSHLDVSTSDAFDAALSGPAGPNSNADAVAGASEGLSSLSVAQETDPLIQTVRKLVNTGYTALPIVPTGGLSSRPVGIISVRDLRTLLLSPQNLRIVGDLILYTSTLTYVAQVRQMDHTKSKFPSISVRKGTPLRAVVQKMLAADIQRVFLVDESGELTGIFSRTDLGRTVARTIQRLVKQHSS